jgi:glycosyltransferase involved in cell wall biosynthesis
VTIHTSVVPSRFTHASEAPDGLRGATILVAHPSSDDAASATFLVGTVEALVGAGARVVVAFPHDGPLAARVLGAGAEVLSAPSAVVGAGDSRLLGLPSLLMRTARALVVGVLTIRRVNAAAVYVSTATIPVWILAARLTGRSVLCHVREVQIGAWPSVGAASAAPLLLATRIVASSRLRVDLLGRALPGVARRAEVVHDGVHGWAGALPTRSRLTGGLHVLYMGLLCDREGVDVAVEAMVELRDRGEQARLDIVGGVLPGHERYEEQLRTTIRVLGIEDLVTLHGAHADVTPFLAAADACVVPSRGDEPFGDTAVEALLAARPVVISDTSGLREAAGGYESAQMVPPSDPAALADALQDIATDWDAYRARAARDRFRAEHRHGPELYRQRIAQSVGTMLSAAKRTGSPPPASSR